jgi:hypothetical protein
VNLPGTVVEGSEFWLSVTLRGRLEPQELEREAILQDGQDTIVAVPMEPRYLYSNRSTGIRSRSSPTTRRC